MTTCPCGTGIAEAACCGPIVAGAAAPTALALMRSRYTAYVRGAMAHLVDTHDPSTRAGLDVAGATRWSRETTWLGLEIVATQRGTVDDDDGEVEHIARGATRGVPFAQHERSRFRRVAGSWYYLDGVKVVAAPAQRAVSAGRNQPCPCGSGKKYKVCHGR